MRSFHQSRGKMLFEVLCALVIAASCAGAWMQTGAWALLPVALVALLYSVVHAFELARRNPVSAADPERIDFATDQHSSVLVGLDSGVPLAATNQTVTTDAFPCSSPPTSKLSWCFRMDRLGPTRRAFTRR